MLPRGVVVTGVFSWEKSPLDFISLFSTSLKLASLQDLIVENIENIPSLLEVEMPNPRL